MQGYSQHDIRGASFEEFVDFLFAREVVPTPEDINVGPFPSYWPLREALTPWRLKQRSDADA